MVKALDNENPEAAGQPNARTIDTAPTSGLRKAAVMVLVLDEPVATRLLGALNDDEVRLLVEEISRLGLVDHATVQSVLDEFQGMCRMYGILREGGVEQAARLIERSFPPERARRLVHVLHSQRSRLPFAFLSQAETDSLVSFLAGEHPQTIAVVMAHMDPAKSAEILHKLPEALGRDVLARIGSLEGAHAVALRQLEKSLRKYMDTSMLSSRPRRAGGTRMAAAILREAGEHGRGILDGLHGQCPAVAREIESRLVALDDFAALEGDDLRSALDAVGPRLVAVVLKTARPELDARIRAHLYPHAVQVVDSELDQLGAVSLEEVESASAAIVDEALSRRRGHERRHALVEPPSAVPPAASESEDGGTEEKPCALGAAASR
jgi:flagellar motor switch protein FliG